MKIKLKTFDDIIKMKFIWRKKDNDFNLVENLEEDNLLLFFSDAYRKNISYISIRKNKILIKIEVDKKIFKDNFLENFILELKGIKEEQREGSYCWYCIFTFPNDKNEYHVTEKNNCESFEELQRLWKKEKPVAKLVSAIRQSNLHYRFNRSNVSF